jgi:hypothetical protein
MNIRIFYLLCFKRTIYRQMTFDTDSREKRHTSPAIVQ